MRNQHQELLDESRRAADRLNEQIQDLLKKKAALRELQMRQAESDARTDASLTRMEHLRGDRSLTHCLKYLELGAKTDRAAEQRMQMVEMIAKELQITLHWSEEENLNATAWCPPIREVHIPAPRTDSALAVCLHEIGHVATWQNGLRRVTTPDGRSTVSPAAEWAAWLWAKKFMGYRWTSPMEERARRSLRSYYKYADHAERLLFCDFGIRPGQPGTSSTV